MRVPPVPRHPSLIPLSHDHREALGLAFFLHHPAPPGRETPMTPASTPASRRARLLAFYDANLHAHFRAEEEALFPALRTQADLVARLVDDHGRLAALRAQAVDATGEAAIHAALVAFADLLETHVRCEERELFATFPEGVEPAEVERIGRSIRDLLATRDAATCAITRR